MSPERGTISIVVLRRIGLMLICACWLTACGRIGLELLINTDEPTEPEAPPGPDAEPPDAEPADAEPLVDSGVVLPVDSGPACELGGIDHCGACNNACDATQYGNVAAMACEAGECVIAACAPGFGDCDGLLTDGCERMLTTLLECGACGVPCAIPNAEVSCDTGECTVVGCSPGFGDCDGALANGCETPTTSLEHCGACDAVCDLPGPAVSACTGGRCTTASCTAPFADCDGDQMSCETNLTSLSDCGSCGAACGSNGRLPNASASCATGDCSIGACDNNFGDCDGSASNGCERSLTTLSDCGTCGRSCALSRATASCASGSCSLVSCQTGWDNCDGSPANGCEARLNTVTHCGACGVACGANQTCDGTRCVGQFGFPPGNVNPGGINPATVRDTALSCGASSFNTTTLVFTNWCGTPPTPIVQAQSGGVDLVILPFRDFSIASGASLRVVGNRPFAIVALGNATITGNIDVSASGTTPGPGANQSCGTSAGGNGTGSSSAGGGGGGGAGFGTQGGSGGYGDSDGNQGSRGVARGNASLTPLLAGCLGGQGGGCTTGRPAGGGALQISASGRLDVAGTLRAVGASGVDGCGSEGGGGGGGSGGAILLEADQLFVRASASLLASGGRGGNGGNGGSGGNGGTGSSAAQNGGSDNANGGGGGGGAFGRIRLRGASQCTLTAAASPGATTACP